MNKRAIFASITSMFIVFTYFSLPILRELYGESALLATYGGISILCGVLVYIIFERASKMTNKLYNDQEDKSNNEETEPNNNEKTETDKIVDAEMDSLKN